MKNTNTTDFLAQVSEILASKPSNLLEAITTLSRTYSGDENRFIRQEIIADLIGIKHPIAKCGIGSLTEFTMTYLKALEKEVKANRAAAKAAEEKEGIEGIDYKMNKPTAAERGDEAIAKAEASAEVAALVGTKVVRKACQRQGEVTAIEGQHVTVTLEDGSKRKPCLSRFKKLYIAAA